MRRIRLRAGNFVASVAVLLAGLCFERSTAANEAGRVSAEVGFAHFGLAEGLTHADVRSVVRDHQGFMWFATWLNGLNRYDGYTFKAYRHDSKDERSLGFDNVSVVYEDRQHVLWIGTFGGGLDRYDRDTDTFVHYRHQAGDPNTLVNDTVGVIYEDDKGELWVGTLGGTGRFNRGRDRFTTVYVEPQGNPASVGLVRAICVDRKTGLLWLGSTRAGIIVLDPATGQRVDFTPTPGARERLSRDDVTAIVQDRMGEIWIGTEQGLRRWNPETSALVSYQFDPNRLDSLGSDIVSALLEDRTGRFWVGTANGLDLLDRSTGAFTHQRHDAGNPASLSSNYINVGGIYQDDTGALWVATHDSGVDRLDSTPARFHAFRNDPNNPNSLSQDTVTATFCDHAGNLWIGTASGLDRYDGRSFVRYANDPKDKTTLSAGPVWAITESPDHQLWIGVNGGGLCRFDGTRFVRYQHDPTNPRSLGRDYMYGLQADRHGGLWISLHGRGLDHFDGAGFSHFTSDPKDPESLPDPYVGTLYVDERDCVWMGSATMGLIQFDPSTRKATTYLLDPARPHNKVGNWVRDINSDGKTIWVASYSGLFCFDLATRRFTRCYTEQDGLASSSVLSVQSDAGGDVWVATLAGISRLDVKRQTFRNYGPEDGLQSLHFCERSRARMSDGRVCFGGVAGFNLFSPDRLPDNPVPPPVVLTEFQLYNKPVAIGRDSPLQKAIHVADRITLRHDQEVFRLRFAALDFASPRKSRYAYKLDGFDRDWRYTDANDRSATYTRLDPGNYVFHVTASNSDGVWNGKGTSIAISITPPWWRAWWFLGMSGALTLALGYAGYAVRIQQIKAQNLRLEREVAERTAELTKKGAALEASNRQLESKSSELRESQTELMRLVADLNEKSHALESANRELEAFSYSVSHDLRAPLRSIDGFSRALLEDYSDKLDREGQEDLRLVRAAAQRMGNLIDDMLRLARIGRAQLKWEPVNLSETVTLIATDLGKTERSRSVEFVIAPGCVVEGDASLLRIALENILSNAWKYTGKRPHSRIEFGVMPQNESRAFFVRDNGCGFEMKYAHKLFGAFQRLHSQSEYPGSGIGLASVYRVFQRHGGSVWIEGEVDRGATVYFTIPPRPRAT